LFVLLVIALALALVVVLVLILVLATRQSFTWSQASFRIIRILLICASCIIDVGLLPRSRGIGLYE
jgi:hypothetical protein